MTSSLVKLKAVYPLEVLWLMLKHKRKYIDYMDVNFCKMDNQTLYIY